MTTPAAYEPITRGEFEQAMGRMDARFGQLDARFGLLENNLDGRFAQFEARMDVRFAQSDARMDVRFAQLETAIERSLVTGIRWTVGMILPFYAVLFGFMLFIVGRELPR